FDSRASRRSLWRLGRAARGSELESGGAGRGIAAAGAFAGRTRRAAGTGPELPASSRRGLAVPGNRRGHGDIAGGRGSQLGTIVGAAAPRRFEVNKCDTKTLIFPIRSCCFRRTAN